MIWLKSLGAKLIAIILLAVVVIGLVWFGLAQWQKARTAATESRLQQAQSGATVESAKDAIATQGAAAARETASEDLSRNNEKDIRNAEGSADPVKPAARDAGLRAVCRRAAYRDSERCRLLLSPAP
jgi:uncharacterized protein HemX